MRIRSGDLEEREHSVVLGGGGAYAEASRNRECRRLGRDGRETDDKAGWCGHGDGYPPGLGNKLV